MSHEPFEGSCQESPYPHADNGLDPYCHMPGGFPPARWIAPITITILSFFLPVAFPGGLRDTYQMMIQA